MVLNPEDRVLVGVINRKRDLIQAQQNRWYRIPQKQMSHGINADYLAFFLSGRVFKERRGGIHYYAAIRGLELAYRRDLLPTEADHPRADEVYYRVALGPLEDKTPPVLNPTGRTISFIRTTWDRFIHASVISDLYSQDEYYVDRIYHVLRSTVIVSVRIGTTKLRILCEKGSLDLETDQREGTLYLDVSQPEDKILVQIRAAITQQGGTVSIDIPEEGK